MTRLVHVCIAAADDVIEINETSLGVTMTSANDSVHSQSQNLDNYSVWTSRMNEANLFPCLK